MTTEDTIGQLVAGQQEFKISIALMSQAQNQIAKDVSELVVHERSRNKRIEALELNSAKQSGIMDTMRFVIPASLAFAGVASGVVFGVIQAATN